MNDTRILNLYKRAGIKTGSKYDIGFINAKLSGYEQ